MQNYKTKIQLLINVLESEKILDNLEREIFIADEPKMYTFSAKLNFLKQYSDGVPWNGNAGGFSFFSKELALLKCLVEAAERFCNIAYQDEDLISSSYNNLVTTGLNPSLFGLDHTIDDKKIRWAKGVDLNTNEPVLVPAQIVYFNYKSLKNEPFLSERISTGAAGGVDQDGTLLRGIYEIVERDAFMTMYLIKAPAAKINIDEINNKQVQEIVMCARRYNLELMVFDITNDLTIPSFLGMLIDRTGLGPSISLGLKSSLSAEKALIGCIEETFHTRPWMKRELISREKNQFTFHQKKILSLLERGLLWLSPKMIKHMSFLINQPAKKISLSRLKLDPKKELEIVKKIFLVNKIEVYNSDICLPFLKKIGFFAYKVTVPQLQPLFLHETHREIRMSRLTSVSNYFKLKSFKVNNIPHPFL